MPIQTNNTRLSIDFAFEHETYEGTITYQMKFVHTEAGPILQILNGGYEPIELPAEMFVEVADFLIKQGVMKGNTSKPTAIPGQLPIGNTPLRLPAMRKKASVPVPDIEPVSSISLNEPVEETEQVGDVQVQPEEAADKPKMALSKEEEENILRERAAARAKASKVDKKIKKDHP